jgi:hypothetical protein
MSNSHLRPDALTNGFELGKFLMFFVADMPIFGAADKQFSSILAGGQASASIVGSALLRALADRGAPR